MDCQDGWWKSVKRDGEKTSCKVEGSKSHTNPGVSTSLYRLNADPIVRRSTSGAPMLNIDLQRLRSRT